MKLTKNSRGQQIANGLLLTAISLTLVSLIHLRVFQDQPDFFSFSFKTIKVENPLNMTERLELKNLVSRLNREILKDSVVNHKLSKRSFSLVVYDSLKERPLSRDYLTFQISKYSLDDSTLETQMLSAIKERQVELGSIERFGEDPISIKERLVWISCEPPSLAKISALRKQIRKVLFLQICAAPDKGLVQHLKTNTIEKYLRENTSVKFAMINFKSWSTFEKWNGDLWSKAKEYTERAGVTSMTINQDTQIRQAAAAIDVVESFRGVELL
jgi:hypothetical protein